jgi:hypothetical protein
MDEAEAALERMAYPANKAHDGKVENNSGESR